MQPSRLEPAREGKVVASNVTVLVCHRVQPSRLELSPLISSSHSSQPVLKPGREREREREKEMWRERERERNV